MYQAHDVLAAVIHTILFTRLLKYDQFTSIRVQSLSVTFCKLTAAELEKQVEAAIGAVSQDLADREAVPVHLLFYDRKERKGWLGGKQEAQCWEKWTINIKKVEQREEQLLGRAVSEALLYIASAEINPPEPFETGPYPFKIQVNSKNIGQGESLTSLLRKIISDSNVPPLLG